MTSVDRIIRTVCSPNCSATCGVHAHVRDGRIVKLEPASYPDPDFERICLRGIAMATERVNHPDRLTHPLMRVGERGEGKWRKVSWDEALDYLAEKMSSIADGYGWRANSWISMSGNYGFKSITAAPRIANSLEGTLFSKDGLSSDIAAFMGFFPILGAFMSSNEFSEIGGAKYLLSVGKNIADTAHSEMHFLFDAMENGLKFVMVDPRFSRSAAKADQWIAPRPGTDGALAMGMINVVVTEGLMKTDYVLQHSNASFLIRDDNAQCLRLSDIAESDERAYLQWDQAAKAPVSAGSAHRPELSGTRHVTLKDGGEITCRTAFDRCWEVLRQYTPEAVSKITGVPAGQIQQVAREYATTDPAWIWLGLGAQRYLHGHTMARAWVTLATFCGNIGKPYAGVGTIDGPYVAMQMAAHADWMMPYGKAGQHLSGMTMVETIANEDPYPIKSLWIQSYNFASQSPLFKRFLNEALPKLEMYVVTEQVMTKAAEYADIVLPCVSYYEDDWDLVGGGENWYMQLRRRAIEPIGESRNDFDIFGALCERLGLDPSPWCGDPEEMCRDILAKSNDPRIRAVDWETLKRDGVARVPVERPFTPFRDMKFNTPSGRIEIYQEQFADIGEHVLTYAEPAEGHRSPLANHYPLTLITYKHVHSAHSQHTILPLINEVLPEPRLEIAPADAENRGIADGDMVTVWNDRGSFKVRATVTMGARPGTVSLPEGWWHRHFPEGHPGDLCSIVQSPGQNRILETNWAVYDLLCDVRKDNDQCLSSLHS